MEKKKVVELYTKAVKQGYTTGEYYFGDSYGNGNGQGMMMDKKTAVELYTKRALQEFARGQYYLGDLYRNGDGVAIDKKKDVQI